MIKISLLASLFVFLGCKDAEESGPVNTEAITYDVSYAKGFAIEDFGSYKMLFVETAWPGNNRVFKYALIPNGQEVPQGIEADATLNIPIQSIVVTSTTHIPSLEMLGVEGALKGFPNLDYISSHKTRRLIAADKIKELGQNETINTETTIELGPDAVISFGVSGENKSLSSIKRAGIPVLYNGDWVEKNPLGKAEWIKFFGVLFGKEKEADSIFNAIVNRYESAKVLASKSSHKPQVISGALFKDVWYMPQGDSWAAQLIEDAHASYLYEESTGTGSISLSIEEVLDSGQKATYWIAPDTYTSYADLAADNPIYQKFDAFKQRNIYGFGHAKGETGGLIYYELAPNRPDLVLQDLIAIFHPELLPDHEPHFFLPLEE